MNEMMKKNDKIMEQNKEKESGGRQRTTRKNKNKMWVRLKLYGQTPSN